MKVGILRSYCNKVLFFPNINYIPSLRNAEIEFFHVFVPTNWKVRKKVARELVTTQLAAAVLVLR